MAVSFPVALSPWPSDAEARLAACSRLADEVGGRAEDRGAADGIGAAASALVEREAPGAPQAVKDEATIRVAGYLSQSDFGGIRREEEGPRNVEYALNHAGMFRQSGAKGLLAPWKTRRAGAINGVPDASD